MRNISDTTNAWDRLEAAVGLVKGAISMPEQAMTDYETPTGNLAPMAGFGSLADPKEQMPTPAIQPAAKPAPAAAPAAKPAPAEQPDSMQQLKDLFGPMLEQFGGKNPWGSKAPTPAAPTPSGGSTPYETVGPNARKSALPGNQGANSYTVDPTDPTGSIAAGEAGLGSTSGEMPQPALTSGTPGATDPQGNRFSAQIGRAQEAKSRGAKGFNDITRSLGKNRPPVTRRGGAQRSLQDMQGARPLKTEEDIQAEAARLRSSAGGGFSEGAIQAWMDRTRRFQGGTDTNAFNTRMDPASRELMEAGKPKILRDAQGNVTGVERGGGYKDYLQRKRDPALAPGGPEPEPSGPAVGSAYTPAGRGTSANAAGPAPAPGGGAQATPGGWNAPLPGSTPLQPTPAQTAGIAPPVPQAALPKPAMPQRMGAPNAPTPAPAIPKRPSAPVDFNALPGGPQSAPPLAAKPKLQAGKSLLQPPKPLGT